ncbi:hypothetical protein Plhal304r1_c047g0129271 [Plasmopara halstedii]
MIGTSGNHFIKAKISKIESDKFLKKGHLAAVAVDSALNNMAFFVINRFVNKCEHLGQ